MRPPFQGLRPLACRTFAVGVFEHADPPARRLSLGRIPRKVEHFSDECAAAIVEGHVYRIHNVRFGGKQLNAKILAEFEALQRFVRLQRCLRALAPAPRQDRQQDDSYDAYP
jgi:hypothetical protein